MHLIHPARLSARIMRFNSLAVATSNIRTRGVGELAGDAAINLPSGEKVMSVMNPLVRKSSVPKRNNTCACFSDFIGVMTSAFSMDAAFSSDRATV